MTSAASSTMRRRVLVTGGSSGIGAAIAKALAATGHDVTVVFNHGEQGADALVRSAETLPGSIDKLRCDLADEVAVSALAEAVGNADPYYFGFVHAAGRTCDALASSCNLPQARLAMQVNFWSAVTLCQRLLRPMSRWRNGRVMFVSSVAAHAGIRGNGIYGASKAALEAYARSIADELGSRNVTANCVAPGFIDTPMIGYIGEAERARHLKRIPAQRFGDPREVSAFATYLFSAGGDYVNGATLVMDGGLSRVLGNGGGLS